jgi:hypothetical protein
LVVEGLCKKLHCALTHRLHAYLAVAMRRHEDGGYSATLGVQLGL